MILDYYCKQGKRALPARSACRGIGPCPRRGPADGSVLLQASQQAIQGDLQFLGRVVGALSDLASDASHQVGAERAFLTLHFRLPLRTLARTGAFQTGRAVLKHAWVSAAVVASDMR